MRGKLSGYIFSLTVHETSLGISGDGLRLLRSLVRRQLLLDGRGRWWDMLLLLLLLGILL